MRHSTERDIDHRSREIAFRSIRLLLIAGIAAAVLLGPLLRLRAMSGDEEEEAGFRRAAGHGRVVDVRQKPMVVAWPAGSGPLSPPPLELRIEPTDPNGWWWTGGDSRQKLKADGDGPPSLETEIFSPGAYGPPADTAAPLCRASETAPFAGCRIGLAIMTVSRDMAHEREVDILTGKRPVADGEPPEARASRSERRMFWTHEESGGRLSFAGWDCESGGRAAASLPIGPEKEKSADPVPGSACFKLKSALKRLMPGLFGYEKHGLYSECSIRSGYCSTYFLFRGRVVQLWSRALFEQEKSAMHTRLFLTAWDVLNRQAAWAEDPPDAEDELKEATAHLRNCEAAAAQAKAWYPRRSDMPTHVSRDWGTLAINCRKAGAIARRLVASEPETTEPILRQATRLLHSVEGWSSENTPLYDARLQALEKAGKQESPEMFNALVDYLDHAVVLKEQPEADIYDARLKTARALSLSLKSASAEDRERLRDAARQRYTYLGRDDELAGLYREEVERIRARSGTRSDALIEPLQRLGYAQWYVSDFDGLRRTADELRLLWLAQPPWQDSPLDPFALKRLDEQAGFNLVLFYRNCALKQRRFAEMRPLIEEVLRKMVASLGETNRYVEAARFHQREVINEESVAGAPIGGGYLERTFLSR